MSKKNPPLTLLLTFLLLASPLQAVPPFYERSLEGWYWYQEIGTDPEKREIPEEVALATLHTFKATFTRAVEVATAYPTRKNVKKVMELQQKSIQTAEKFAALWAQLLLANSHLNGQLDNPTSYYGIEAREKLEAQQIETLIAQEKEKYALLFFFDSQNPFSQAAAQMTKNFEENTGWQVLGISLDGGPLPQYPKPRRSTDGGKILGIDTAPAYLLLNAEKNLSFPVGFGAISVEQLKKNIYKQLHSKAHPKKVSYAH